MTLCDGLYCHFKSHDVVRCSQTLGVFQIDLMLSRRQLMVGCFHLDVHILQVQNNITAHIFSQVDGAYVKIAGILMGVRSREPLFIGVE